MDIDLVYLYVNSRDEAWLSRRRQYSQEGRNGIYRFRDNDELMFSLRSVEKYAPWIRTVYIVTDSSMPEWFNTENRRVHIVPHDEIMPPEILPCFNSNVIESYISNIPGLSEVFLYANDDTFFGNEVTPEFFFKDGKPVIRMWEKEFDPGIPDGYYEEAIAKAYGMIQGRYGIGCRYIPWHNIDVYTKRAFDACRAEFREEFARASFCRLRTGNDIQRVIFHFYMLAHDDCTLIIYKHNSRFIADAVFVAASLFPARLSDFLFCSTHDFIRNPASHHVAASLFPSRLPDFFYCSIHDFIRNPVSRYFVSRKPRCICLNDSENTTDEDIIRYQAYMRKLFPQKSAFEK